MCKVVCKELQATLSLGIVQKNHREWRSLSVLAPKANGSTQFCIGFWKVNVISRFNAYTMPWMHELLERLGNAKCTSTLDLTKGDMQIPLTAKSQA